LHGKEIDEKKLVKMERKKMKSKIEIFVIGLMIISTLFMSFPIKISQATTMWNVNFTYNPDPGYYKEVITFTGTTNCHDPVNWTWTFPGNVKKYGNPVTYSFAPDWQNTSYSVTVKVTNTSGDWAEHTRNDVTVKIAFDIYGTVDYSPLYVTVGTNMTFTADIYNAQGTHICPAGYTVILEVVKYPFHQHWAWPGNITGPSDISPGGSSGNLYQYWTADYPGVYQVKITAGTTNQQKFDIKKDNNVQYSYFFTVFR
jgi:hypothetical protein